MILYAYKNRLFQLIIEDERKKILMYFKRESFLISGKDYKNVKRKKMKKCGTAPLRGKNCAKSHPLSKRFTRYIIVREKWRWTNMVIKYSISQCKLFHFHVYPIIIDVNWCMYYRDAEWKYLHSYTGYILLVIETCTSYV